MFNSSNNNSKLNCTTHKKSFEFICLQCNSLYCSKCGLYHLQNNSNHTLQHIDEIKEYLSSSFSDENNNTSKNENTDSDVTNDYKNELNNTWNFIKESSMYIQSLEEKENQITNHYKELHEYLVISEYKQKKPITIEIDSVKEQLKTQIDRLRSLINIISIHHQNTHDKHSSIDNSLNLLSSLRINDEDSSSSSASSNSYSLSSLVESVRESKTLRQFISNNNKTIFDQNNNNNILNYKSTLSDNVDLIILEFINKHNQLYNNNSSNIEKMKLEIKRYSIDIIKESVQLMKDILNESLKIDYLKPTYILSTHSKGRAASIIDITDNNDISVEEIAFNYFTFASSVRVGDHIFIFGGYTTPDKDGLDLNRYCRYSITSRSIEYLSDATHFDLAQWSSACYDEKDYIYLIGGYRVYPRGYHNAIDRFNIHTSKFERIFLCEINVVILSFFYQGLIYSVPTNDNCIYIFNPTKLSLEKYIPLVSSVNNNQNINFMNINSACTDGEGNIYIMFKESSKGFTRFNISSATFEKLSSITDENNAKKEFDFDCISMIYHKRHKSNRSFIYFLGGKQIGNYQYSIESNVWTVFNADDQFDRRYCGSIVFNE